MSIVLKAGGTTTTAGGTDQTFNRSNATVVNGNEYVDVAEADFFLREKVIISVRPPALQADGSWSKMKISARFVKPITLANGDVSFQIARHEVEVHPEASAAVLAEMREMGGQLAVSAAMNAVYTAGTLPA